MCAPTVFLPTASRAVMSTCSIISPCGWIGQIRTDGMEESKSSALPLGYNPISENLTLYCMYKYVFTLHIYKSELFNHQGDRTELSGATLSFLPQLTLKPIQDLVPVNFTKLSVLTSIIIYIYYKSTNIALSYGYFNQLSVLQFHF